MEEPKYVRKRIYLENSFTKMKRFAASKACNQNGSRKRSFKILNKNVHVHLAKVWEVPELLTAIALERQVTRGMQGWGFHVLPHVLLMKHFQTSTYCVILSCFLFASLSFLV